MDTGLGNLLELKKRLLASTMLTQTTWDATIAQIGRGVAAWFDQHCNRKLGRLAGAVDLFSADRTLWITQRYPIEAVTTLEQRDAVSSGWTALTVNEAIRNRDDSAGHLQFGAVLGSHLSQLRLTYTGGYWFDTTEDGTGVMPGAATLLPADIKEAWFLQCEAVWAVRDKLGGNLLKVGAGTESDVAQSIAGLEMIPLVKAKLRTRVRMAIT